MLQSQDFEKKLQNKSTLANIVVYQFSTVDQVPTAAWYRDLGKLMGVGVDEAPEEPVTEEVGWAGEGEIDGASIPIRKGRERDGGFRNPAAPVDNFDAAPAYQPTMPHEPLPVNAAPAISMDDVDRRIEERAVALINQIVPGAVSQYAQGEMQRLQQEAPPQSGGGFQRPSGSPFGWHR